jgi:hypothetical protein
MTGFCARPPRASIAREENERMHKISLVIVVAALTLLSTDLNAQQKKPAKDSKAEEEVVYLWPVTPPAGWFHNREGSEKVGLQVMTSKPKDADALIYIEANPLRNDLAFSKIVAAAAEDLRRSSRNAKVTRLPEVARKNGNPPFQLFRIEQPSKPHQPLEFVAYGKAAEPDGTLFILTVTIAGHDAKVIEGYGEIYRTFLAAH